MKVDGAKVFDFYYEINKEKLNHNETILLINMLLSRIYDDIDNGKEYDEIKIYFLIIKCLNIFGTMLNGGHFNHDELIKHLHL